MAKKGKNLARRVKRDVPCATNAIRAYLHCGLCLVEWKDKVPEALGESPASYARLSVGWTPIGLQVWCERHHVNVMHVDFEKCVQPANTTRLLKLDS